MLHVNAPRLDLRQDREAVAARQPARPDFDPVSHRLLLHAIHPQMASPRNTANPNAMAYSPTQTQRAAFAVFVQIHTANPLRRRLTFSQAPAIDAAVTAHIRT